MNQFSKYMKKYQLECRNPYSVIINDKIKIKDYCEERLNGSIIDELFKHRIYTGYRIESVLSAVEPPCVVRLNNGWHKMKILLTCDDYITSAELKNWQSIKFTDYWWAFKQIRPGFTVERLLPLRHNLLKFFVFNGRVEYVWQQQYTIEGGEIGKLTFATMHDRKWNKINVQWKKSPYPNCPKPKRLDEMIYISEKLSYMECKKVWPFLRVDLYYNHDNIRLSEVMDTHAGGSNGFSGDFDFKLYEKLGI